MKTAIKQTRFAPGMAAKLSPAMPMMGGAGKGMPKLKKKPSAFANFGKTGLGKF